jgi:hypothetical protein
VEVCVNRILYLAVPDSIYEAVFGEVLIKSLLDQYPIKLIVYVADIDNFANCDRIHRYFSCNQSKQIRRFGRRIKPNTHKLLEDK